MYKFINKIWYFVFLEIFIFILTYFSFSSTKKKSRRNFHAQFQFFFLFFFFVSFCFMPSIGRLAPCPVHYHWILNVNENGECALSTLKCVEYYSWEYFASNLRSRQIIALHYVTEWQNCSCLEIIGNFVQFFFFFFISTRRRFCERSWSRLNGIIHQQALVPLCWRDYFLTL